MECAICSAAVLNLARDMQRRDTWEGERHGKARDMERRETWEGVRHGKARDMERRETWEGERHMAELSRGGRTTGQPRHKSDLHLQVLHLQVLHLGESGLVPGLGAAEVALRGVDGVEPGATSVPPPPSLSSSLPLSHTIPPPSLPGPV